MFYRNPTDTPLTPSDVSLAARDWPLKATRRPRRWLLASALLAIPTTCALLFYLTAPTLSTRLWPVAQGDRAAIEAAIRPPPRDRDEREHGVWRPRVPPVTEDDLRTEYNGWYETTERLPETVAAALHTDDEREAAERARAATLASWEWAPTRNASLPHDWDWRTWAVRALRATGGVVVVGDSIHLQLFHHLRSMLPPTFELREDYARVYGFSDPNSVQPAYLDVFLQPEDPLADELLAASGAPPERLSRPVLSYVRDDLLMAVRDVARLRDDAVREITDDGDPLATPDAVAAAWAEFTARFGGEFDTAKEGSDGVTNVVIGGWRPRVDKLLEPIGAWRGLDKTILVINTGAHWSGPCLPEIGEARLKRVYERMLQTIAPQLVALSARAAVLFRPTVPGHPNCEAARAPYASEADARAALANMDFFADMAWGTFASYNTMWRAALPAAIGWLPVFTRTIMRPEAHRLGGDCLHLEGPSLLGEWAAEIWRVLYDLERDAQAH